MFEVGRASVRAPTLALRHYPKREPGELDFYFHDLSVLERVAGTLEVLALDFPYSATCDFGPDFCLPAVQHLILRGWPDRHETLRILPDLRTMRLQGCQFRSNPNTVVHPDLLEAEELDELAVDTNISHAFWGPARSVQLRRDPFQRASTVSMLIRCNPVVLSCLFSMSRAHVVDYRELNLPRLRYLELSLDCARMRAISLRGQVVSHSAH